MAKAEIGLHPDEVWMGYGNRSPPNLMLTVFEPGFCPRASFPCFSENWRVVDDELIAHQPRQIAGRLGALLVLQVDERAQARVGEILRHALDACIDVPPAKAKSPG
jgi:hypothetical protein